LSQIEIEIINYQKTVVLDRRKIRKTIEYVLRQFGIQVACVSIAVVGHDRITELKGRYFGRKISTDVISFDLQEAAGSSDEKVRMDCEIVVNGQRAAEWAEAHGTEAEAELHLYIVHGLLHQLGYDDQTAEEAGKMHKKENQLLKELGFGKVYRIEKRKDSCTRGRS